MGRLFRLVFAWLIAFTVAAGPLVAAPVARGSDTRFTSSSAPADPSAPTWPAWLYGLTVIGAIRIKDMGAIGKKFVQRASAAGGDYKSGVEASGQDWETNTKASEENYVSGVTQAASAGRFGKGVAKAGAQKFVTRAANLGAQRYPTGVGAAEQDFVRGAAPFVEALRGMDLPPRRPTGDPGNQARANAVATKLRAVKLAQ